MPESALKSLANLPLLKEQQAKREIAVKFDVTFKGIRWYSGRLSDAFEYVQHKWGSTDAAWEKGVKLTPVIKFELGR